uniref:Integrase catalytic domain-containing protein n=1 Tax=Anopheles atroparvus TaxID=41427 RepID=A0AAG5DPK9_ANOAO
IDTVISTYACLDDGSSSTFIEHELLSELGLTGVAHPLCLRWTGNQGREEAESVRLTLSLSGTIDGSETFELPKVYTVKSLVLPRQSLDPLRMAKRYPYLKDAHAQPYANVRPRMLIGMDNCQLGQAQINIDGKAGEPAASKTRLGWIIYGPYQTASATQEEMVNMHHGVHVCPCAHERDDHLNNAVKDFFTIESLGIAITTKGLHSKENERAMQILGSETKNKGGYYETGLLWRNENVQLPCNKDMAFKRYSCLRRKMERDPALGEEITRKMMDYESKGYIRRVSADELATSHQRDWYLPIFPVTNPNKPGKLRMVFDAAAKVNGVSLNSHLIAGPDQLTNLLSVLLKFREFRVAVAGDIREMFFQVRMKPEDQCSQRFLWSFEGKEEPDVYAVTVMTFGAACSPSSAQYVKNVNAERFRRLYPRAVDCIINEHYVDDMLASVETESEAVTLAEEVRLIHSQGGFEIRNWISNSTTVVDRLRGQQPESSSVNLCSEPHAEKVLGMWWDTVADTFTFRPSPKHDQTVLSGVKVPTKREVLRTLMAIYDPMGLIGNFLIYAKVLLQDIWRAGLEWDQQISGELAEKWKAWIAVLPNVQHISIPRCYRRVTSAKFRNVQLHIFCDASENAMAALAYLRFEEGKTVECALVASKTRVAPLKYMSIPRLELQAATIGARLAMSLADAHRMRITRRVYWTDSKNVLSWLRSDHRRYSQFVAFRVGELLESTDPNEWRWLSTKDNVADEGTKWQRTPDFSSSSRWLRGPDFLWESEEKWPGFVNVNETQEELRPTMLHHAIAEPLIRFNRFSKWKRLLRATGFVLRFLTNTRNRVRGKPTQEGPLTQDELASAERVIFITAQQQAFPEEMRRLNDPERSRLPMKEILPKASPLYKLAPELDEHGVLRTRGRLMSCPWVNEDTKRPIILPRNHRATSLLLGEYHLNYHHRNHQAAINEARARFHISRINSEFLRARKSCQHCKNRDAVPEPPMMGDLPEERLAAFHHPFTYTGIDYFGPMTVAVGRRTEKRWGVIFTCLTTRGIHLELAASLNTTSCILAIRRFISRRGSPVEIRSDCGTNFVGASRELKQALQQVDRVKLMEEFSSPNVRWTFNPPAAPHFGGCWERLIQSVKRCLNELQLPRLPTDEILQTVMTEIEMTINSRPLTHVPLDDVSEPPLTPNHFILGSSHGYKPPIALDDSPAALRSTWRSSEKLANLFWEKWVRDYLPTLTRRSKWFHPVKPVEIGDVVLIADGNLPRNCWPKGRIIAVAEAADGQVRSATVKTANALIVRPATKIAVLDVGAKHKAVHQCTGKVDRTNRT